MWLRPYRVDSPRRPPHEPVLKRCDDDRVFASLESQLTKGFHFGERLINESENSNHWLVSQWLSFVVIGVKHFKSSIGSPQDLPLLVFDMNLTKWRMNIAFRNLFLTWNWFELSHWINFFSVQMTYNENHQGFHPRKFLKSQSNREWSQRKLPKQ